MADQHPNSDAGKTVSRITGQPPGMPRWVKLFGLIAIVLLLLVVGLHLTGRAPFMQVEHGMQQP
jgi:hypothetical protein